MENIKITQLENGYRLLFNPASSKKRYTLQLIGEGDEILEERAMVGVTTVLGVINKPALMKWPMNEAFKWIDKNVDLKKEEKAHYYKLTKGDIKEAMLAHTKKSELAMDTGTEAHSFIENYIKECIAKGGSPIEWEFCKPNEDIKHIVFRFVNWAVENVKEFLESEQAVASIKYGYAGTFDFMFIDHQDKKVIGDFKTSNAIYGSEYNYQASAYAKAKGGKIDYTLIFRSDKLKDEEIIEYNKVNFKYPKTNFDIERSYCIDDNFLAFKGALLLYRKGSGQESKNIEQEIDNILAEFAINQE